MTTPAVSVLKESFPQAAISYIIEEPYKELVEGNPALSKVIILPKNLSTKEFIKYIRKVRQEKYDVAIDFHGGPTASLIALFSKAKLKIGYRIKYKNFIYDIKLPREPKKGTFHSVENHINLVKALGITTTYSAPLFLPKTQEAEMKRVKTFLSKNNLNNSRVIILHISAGNKFRDWGTDNITKLVHLLSEFPNVKIVLVGACEDKSAEEKILKKSTVPLFSLVDRINLRELKELISRSSLFVGPDSGPMHIAASTSTPIVAYFGPTLPANFAPWQANAFIIEKEFECRPCKQRHCIYGDFRCLRNITPEEVYRACLTFLQ